MWIGCGENRKSPRGSKGSIQLFWDLVLRNALAGILRLLSGTVSIWILFRNGLCCKAGGE